MFSQWEKRQFLQNVALLFENHCANQGWLWFGTRSLLVQIFYHTKSEMGLVALSGNHMSQWEVFALWRVAHFQFEHDSRIKLEVQYLLAMADGIHCHPWQQDHILRVNEGNYPYSRRKCHQHCRLERLMLILNSKQHMFKELHCIEWHTWDFIVFFWKLNHIPRLCTVTTVYACSVEKLAELLKNQWSPPFAVWGFNFVKLHHLIAIFNT